MYVQKADLEKDIEFRGIKNLSGFLIIEVKINFRLGFDNRDYQTNKLYNVHALHCTLVLNI